MSKPILLIGVDLEDAKDHTVYRQFPDDVELTVVNDHSIEGKRLLQAILTNEAQKVVSDRYLSKLRACMALTHGCNSASDIVVSRYLGGWQ